MGRESGIGGRLRTQDPDQIRNKQAVNTERQGGDPPAITMGADCIHSCDYATY